VTTTLADSLDTNAGDYDVDPISWFASSSR